MASIKAVTFFASAFTNLLQCYLLHVIVNINSNVPKLDETWFQVVVHCTHTKWCKWFYFLAEMSLC